MGAVEIVGVGDGVEMVVGEEEGMVVVVVVVEGVDSGLDKDFL